MVDSFLRCRELTRDKLNISEARVLTLRAGKHSHTTKQHENICTNNNLEHGYDGDINMDMEDNSLLVGKNSFHMMVDEQIGRLHLLHSQLQVIFSNKYHRGTLLRSA